MIIPFIIRNSSVRFETRSPNMETQKAENLPVPSPRTLLTLPTRLSPDLDGSLGANRGERKSCQIAASTDIEAICVWLAEYRDSPHTLRSYQREVSRLLAWFRAPMVAYPRAKDPTGTHFSGFHPASTHKFRNQEFPELCVLAGLLSNFPDCELQFL